MSMVLGALFVAGCVQLAAPPVAEGDPAWRAAGVVRVASWNIEGVGSPGSTEYNATAAVIQGIDPDVLAVQELGNTDDVLDMEDLAIDLGYSWITVADPAFGGDRNAVISRFPIVDVQWMTPDVLSGDPAANDVSRMLIRVTVDADGTLLTLIPVHFKSGGFDDDEFRRSVDAMRTVQALDGALGEPMVLGDFNEEIVDLPLSPPEFVSLPPELPSSYWLGDDLWDLMNDEGLRNDPFAILADGGLSILDAQQPSGSEATRPVSGRRLDHIAVGPALAGSEAGVADASDPNTDIASDHLMVWTDVVSGASPGDALQPGDLVITRLMPDPTLCSDADGEWIELHNTTGHSIGLLGVTVTDASGHEGALGEGTVGADGRVIVGRGDAFCGPEAAAVYGGELSLNNAGDTLQVWSGDTLIDDPPSYDGSDPGIALVRVDPGWCSEGEGC